MLCGFGQFGDVRCATLCCFGKLVLNRNCDLNVPNATIDKVLTVDVGGNVNFPATTIDLTNSTIDFTGASITGLSGEIDGNLVFSNLSATTITAEKIFGNLCGNVTSDRIVGNVTGTLLGNVIGCIVCGNNIITSQITEKNGGAGIIVNGTLNADVCGDISTDEISSKSGGNINALDNIQGTFSGAFNGDVFTDCITEATSGSGTKVDGNLIVTGTLFAANTVTTITGNFCGNVITDRISDKSGGNIQVVSKTVFEQDVCFGASINSPVVRVDVLSDNLLGSILITGNTTFTAPAIMTKLIVTDLCTTGNITAQKFTGNLCGNVDAKNVFADNISLNGDLTLGNVNVEYDVCIERNLQTDSIIEKTLNAGIIIDEVLVKDNTITARKFTGNLCGNVDAKNVFADNISLNGDLTLGNVNVEYDVCIERDLQTDSIIEKTMNAGIIIDEVLIKDNTITARKFTGNLCGNVISENIIVDDLTVNDELNFTGNLNVNTIDATKFTGNLCGNVISDNIIVDDLTVGDALNFTGNLSVNTIDATKFTGNLCGNVNANHVVCSNAVINNVCVNNAILVETINEKNDGEGVMVTSNVFIDGVANVCNELFVPVVSEKIQNAGIAVNGNVTVNNSIVIIGKANVCDELITPMISEKSTDNGILVNGNLVLETIVALSGNLDIYGNIVLHSSLFGDVVGNVMFTNEIRAITADLDHIAIGGNVNVVGDNLNVLSGNLNVENGGDLRLVGGNVDLLGNTSALRIAGIQIIGEQLSKIKDLSVPGGTPDDTIESVVGTGDDANVNANFLNLATKINAIFDLLKTHGLMSSI